MSSISDSQRHLIEIKGENLLLLAEKAIYWPKKEMLLIADLHLGKATHFRSRGIAVPARASLKNWEALNLLFMEHQPKRVCFLGDLFHSTHNVEWEVFGDLIKAHPQIQFDLVIGNHDILAKEKYHELGFQLSKKLIEAPFIFTHEPLESINDGYNLAGHIHPGVRLRGKGRQTIRAACFYFGDNHGILPAFGSFTGFVSLDIKKDDQVFPIINNQLIAI